MRFLPPDWRTFLISSLRSSERPVDIQDVMRFTGIAMNRYFAEDNATRALKHLTLASSLLPPVSIEYAQVRGQRGVVLLDRFRDGGADKDLTAAHKDLLAGERAVTCGGCVSDCEGLTVIVTMARSLTTGPTVAVKANESCPSNPAPGV